MPPETSEGQKQVSGDVSKGAIRSARELFWLLILSSKNAGVTPAGVSIMEAPVPYEPTLKRIVQ